MELKWLFLVIIGDAERALGIPHASTILFWFHRNADSLIKMGNSLQNVCELLFGETGEDHVLLNNNLLCKPFRPMLLKRLEYNKNCLPKVKFIIFDLFLDH